jgi:hypothetical protein
MPLETGPSGWTALDCQRAFLPFGDMLDIDLTIAELAATQGGAFTLQQARRRGATPSLIHRRRSSGQWRQVAPGVMVVPGAPRDERQFLWIVRLSLGRAAVFSHETAARGQGVSGVPADVHAVSVGWGHHRTLDGVRVHQQRVDPTDVVVRDGLPMTSLARTVCDLATVFSPARLAHVVDSAHFDGGCSFVSMGETLLRVGTRGRPGASRLIPILDERGPGADVAASVLEARLDEVLATTSLPDGIAQHPLPGRGRRRGLVDRAFPEAQLIVEADGRRWHARRAAMATDRQRDIEAARSGWQTLRPMYEHLVGDPDDTAAAIEETYLLRLGRAA